MGVKASNGISAGWRPKKRTRRQILGALEEGAGSGRGRSRPARGHGSRTCVLDMRSGLRLPGAVDPTSSELPDGCVCAALRMLSRYASRRLERVLAGHGLTLTEFQLMLTLQEIGPARVLALARRLQLDPSATGRSLARL